MLKTQYRPDYVTPPGATLEEALGAIGMSQAELAERTGRPKKMINEIIKGKAAITSATAIQLEAVLSIPAAFWNNRESRYQEFLARQQAQRQLEKYFDWVKNFPMSAMQEFGWIEKDLKPTELLQALLRYFGVVSPDQWIGVWAEKQAAFRKSPAFESNWFATSAWLRRGEIESQRVDCVQFNQAVFKSVLIKARELTMSPLVKVKSQLQDLCKNAGVAVVFVPELPKTRVSGATQWISPNKAIIHLSFRYKTDDHFWFTFFHEAGHILLHGKKEFFVDDDRTVGLSTELEADEFSKNLLIPRDAYAHFLARGRINAFRIHEFSREIGIAPGIIVGRLQREKILSFKILNGLKTRYSN